MRGGTERTEHGRGEGEGGGMMEDKEEREEGQWNMEEGGKGGERILVHACVGS